MASESRLLLQPAAKLLPPASKHFSRHLFIVHDPIPSSCDYPPTVNRTDRPFHTRNSRTRPVINFLGTYCTVLFLFLSLLPHSRRNSILIFLRLCVCFFSIYPFYLNHRLGLVGRWRTVHSGLWPRGLCSWTLWTCKEFWCCRQLQSLAFCLSN